MGGDPDLDGIDNRAGECKCWADGVDEQVVVLPDSYGSGLVIEDKLGGDANPYIDWKLFSRFSKLPIVDLVERFEFGFKLTFLAQR